jgi:F0F1-type ATP synthase membrane subunit b/b'
MLSTIEEQVVQAGLVDIDGTFVIQLGVFLVFFALFSALVVKPLIRTYRLRYERMQGAREAADAFTARAAAASSTYEAKIDEARKSAVHIRNDLKSAAEEKSRAQLEGVERESARVLESGRAVIADDALAARTDVEAQVEELAQLVAARVLGGDSP